MGATELKSFISYRRDDAIVVGNVDRIYEQLSGHFGGENVFMDVDTIPPGQDFRAVLDEAVAQADVLLAVMGKDWVKFIKKRSRDPRDFVRIELESAFQRNIPVVPVLIGDTKMPLEKQLPPSIRKLAFCNAVRIDPRRYFQADVERLIADLEQHYGKNEGGRMKDEMAESVETTPLEPIPVSAAPEPGPDPEPQTDRGRGREGGQSTAGSERIPTPARERSPVVGIALATVAAIGGLALFIAKPWSPPTPTVEEGVSLSPERPTPSQTTSEETEQPAPPPPKPEESLTASSTRPYTNTLGMQFVPVPDTDPPILMSVWETRVQDYAAYAAENPGIDLSWKDYEYNGHKQGPDHPVINVSWEDAKRFCEWLSKKEGRTYRLPTDHEWSVAVGIGDREDLEASPEDRDAEI